jgi:hypothetical protein
MVDGRLHRALHLGAQRRDDLVVPDGDRSPTFGQAQLLQALFHDAHRLAHLLHADAVAVVIVAVLADRDVEIELGIAFVGLRSAQVPGGAGAAHHDPGKTPTPGGSRVGGRVGSRLNVVHGNYPLAGLLNVMTMPRARRYD